MLIEKKTKEITIVLYIAIIASVLSQMEVLSMIMRPAMYISWLTIFVYFLVCNGGKLRISSYTFQFLVIYGFYIIYCLVCSALGYNHLNGEYIRILAIPALMSVIGDCFGETITIREIYTICKVYIVMALCFALWVNIEYFPSYSNWLQQMTYTFSQKNSAAQIWCSAVLILIFIVKRDRKWKYVLSYLAIGYLIFISAISQCRTALLAIGIVGLSYLLIYSKRRLAWLFFLLIAIMWVWNTSFSREFIDQVFFINKFEGADLNTVSSGRLDLYKESIMTFFESPIIGVGRWYVDCSYLSILTESGIIGFLMIEYIWIKRLIINLKYKQFFNRFIIFITIFYIVESALEGFPPFGPGVSSFMFWLLSSMLLKLSSKNNKTDLIFDNIN